MKTNCTKEDMSYELKEFQEFGDWYKPYISSLSLCLFFYIGFDFRF